MEVHVEFVVGRPFDPTIPGCAFGFLLGVRYGAASEFRGVDKDYSADCRTGLKYVELPINAGPDAPTTTADADTTHTHIHTQHLSLSSHLHTCADSEQGHTNGDEALQASTLV